MSTVTYICLEKHQVACTKFFATLADIKNVHAAACETYNFMIRVIKETETFSETPEAAILTQIMPYKAALEACNTKYDSDFQAAVVEYQRELALIVEYQRELASIAA